MHSTRGGAAYGREFDGTLSWFANPASQVSAHVVFGVDGRRARVVDDENAAWHAGLHNATWLGAELEQPFPGQTIFGVQYDMLREWLLEMSAKYHIPLDAQHVVEHKDMPQGIMVGKSDVGYPFDMQRLLEGLS